MNNKVERHGGSSPPQSLKVKLSGENIRAFVTNTGEYFFNSVDLAKALGNNKAKQFRQKIPAEMQLKYKDIVGGCTTHPHKESFTKTHGANPQTIYVTETGMWLSILSGRTKVCQDLKTFVAEEVLPQISRTGSFISNLSDKEKENKLPNLGIIIEEDSTTPSYVAGMERELDKEKGSCPRTWKD